MKVTSGPGKLVSGFSRLQAFPSPPARVPATLLRGSCTPENGRNLPTSDLASLPSGFFPVVLSQSPTRGSPPTLDKPAPRQQGSRRQNLPVTQVQGGPSAGLPLRPCAPPEEPELQARGRPRRAAALGLAASGQVRKLGLPKRSPPQSPPPRQRFPPEGPASPGELNADAGPGRGRAAMLPRATELLHFARAWGGVALRYSKHSINYFAMAMSSQSSALQRRQPRPHTDTMHVAAAPPGGPRQSRGGSPGPPCTATRGAAPSWP